MYCTQDCTCSLCRELRGFKPTIACNKQSKYNAGQSSNDNFILRRRLSDIDEYNKPPVRRVESVYKKTLTKSESYNELWKRFDPRNVSKKKVGKDTKNGAKDYTKKVDGHKVIIYFSDSIPHKRQPLVPYKKDGDDFEHARRLCEDIDDKKTGKNSTKVMITKDENNNRTKIDDNLVKTKTEMDVMMQLKTVLNEKNKPVTEAAVPVIKTVVELSTVPIVHHDKCVETKNGDDRSLPSFIESVVNGVINIKVENNFEHASKLVRSISKGPLIIGNVGKESEDYFDCSFVQEWLTR